MIEWRKSTYSGTGEAGGQECVQIGITWRKSSRSGTGTSGGQECVEVASIVAS